MGSRYKTVKGFGYSEMFKDSEDTFVANLVRTAGAAHTTSSDIMGPALLNINRSLNYTLFKQLDGSATSSMHLVNIDDAKALAIISDPDKLAIVGTSVMMTSIGYAYSAIWGMYGDPVWTVCPSGTGWHMWGGKRIASVHATNNDADVIFEDCAGGNSTVALTGLLAIPAYNVVYSLASGGTNSLVIPGYRIETAGTEDDTVNFLSFMLKANFVEIDSKNTTVLKSTFGIPLVTPDAVSDEDKAEEVDDVDTLEDMMLDPTVKHIWVSYSVEYKDPYTGIIDDLIALGDYGFESHGVTFRHRRRGPGTNVLFVDGVPQPDEADEDGQPAQYMIPLEWLKDERNLKEKYKDVENCLKIWVFKEEKIKLKWYETGLFRILSWVAAIVAAYFGYYQMLLGMISSSIINKVFGAKAGIIISIVVAIYSFDFKSIASAVTKALNIFQFVANIAAKIFSLYFMSESEKLAAKAEAREEGMEETQDAIDELSAKSIYWAITDQLDNMYYTMYELPYAIYDAAYSTDRFLTLPRTTAN